MNYKKYIEENIIRCDYSRRGGGIEISLDKLLNGGRLKMTAYQNYLGGGMLGAICNSYNFDPEQLSDPLLIDEVENITEALNRYFHDLTNAEAEDWDSWSSSDYEANQSRPESAY